MKTLNQSHRSTLNQIADDLGFDINESYSGRGMFGKSCFGFTIGQYESAPKIMGEVIMGLMQDEDPEMEELADMLLRQVNTDSMGRGQILYFPNLSWK